MRTTHPLLGQELGGYLLESVLGSGGMGTVFQARDGGGEPVAFKLLHPGFNHDEQARERLRREVATLHRVRGAGVAQVIDAELEGDHAFIVTELIDGQTLDQSVAAMGPLGSAELAEFAVGMAIPLGSIHAVGVIHRDLKPSNVMLTARGPVLIDFGISQAIDDARITSTGLVTGTPGYVDPAVVAGGAVNTDADWWGWAAVLVFAATGRPPFGSGPWPAVLARVNSGAPDVDGVHPRIAAALTAALQPDPGQRMRATQVLEEIELAAQGGADPTAIAGAEFAGPAGGAGPAGPAGIAGTAVVPGAPAASPPPTPLPPTFYPPGANAGEASGLTDAGAGNNAGNAGAASNPVPPTRPMPATSHGQLSPPLGLAQDGQIPDATIPGTPIAGASTPGAPTPGTPIAGAPIPGAPIPGAQWPLMPGAAPDWAQRPPARPWLAFTGWLALTAIALRWPVVALGIAVIALLILGTVGAGSRALRNRRWQRGLRRGDGVVNALKLPAHLLYSVITNVPGVLLGGAGAAILWLLVDVPAHEGLVTACAVAVCMLFAWGLPSAAMVREGAWSALKTLAPGRVQLVWLIAGIALTVAGVLLGMSAGWQVEWWPLMEPGRI